MDPELLSVRPVIDDSYSVSMTALCKDIAAQQAYQVDPLHHEFVNKFKTFWTRVQVYDAE